MKVRVEIGELVLDGLSEHEAAAFAGHMEAELARRLEAPGALGGPGGGGALEPGGTGGRPDGAGGTAGRRAVEEARVLRARPAASAADAAADVATVVARALGG